MPVSPPVCDFGWKAADFRLPDTTGRTWDLGGLRGPNGLLLMFICNHCPYVKSVTGKLVAEARELAGLGIGTAAICSNDAASHPEDNFENMAVFARERGFPFPYLHDAEQRVARVYDAACTPDFFGFNTRLELQYRGRLDDAGRSEAPGSRRELFDAMRQIAETGEGPRDQVPSMGCSIKWKAA
jgi:peroxiredoxin